LPITLPDFNFEVDFSTLLTIISLLFTILVGFFIAAATSNYNNLQMLIAKEDSISISLYNLAKIIDSEQSKKIAECIDAYTIQSLNFELNEYIDRTQNEYIKLMEKIDNVNPTDERGFSALQVLYNKRDELTQVRHEISMVSRNVITGMHWSILILLAIIIIVLSFEFRDKSLATNAIIGILTVGTYLILLLTYEIDNNLFLEDKIAYLNSQNIFKHIGKLGYFPQRVIQSGRIEKPKENYRMGIFDHKKNNYDIKIVKVNKSKL
jgi:preprotein translocase subunit SecF